jgi:N-acetylglucosaminyldiphosphoundecaprenol N-acetyl-beta-D-mannosaminyltransferase
VISNQYLLGLKISDVDVNSLHDHIDHCISVEKKSRIGNLNINAANIGFENEWYKNYVNSCDIVFCDGKGIQLGLLISRKKIPPHITYHTWIWDLASFCEGKVYNLFLLGSKRGVGEKAIEKLLLKYPKLNVQTHHGYFDKTNNENNIVIEKINNFNTDVLIVGFGMPAQEKWILDNMSKLNAKVYLNGGAYLDWISGINKKAPTWITKIGFEWFYRLLKEPIRLFNRYVIGNPLFIYRVIKERVEDK